MKLALTIIFLGFCNCFVLAQDKKNFFKVDEHAVSVQATYPDSLVHILVAPFTTDAEKVRAIFRWITNNIAYNALVLKKVQHRFSKVNIIEEDTSSVYKTLNERISEQVLKKRVAICDGYARLFKTLCDKAGIRSEVIRGYGRSGGSNVRSNFRSNHSWNAVYFDSSWHLLDATWASGYFLFNSDEFIQHYDDFYFLTPPEVFIQTHYPEDPQWSLLSDIPLLKEFYHTPFRSMAFTKYKITSFSPAKGMIEASVGDTLLFELETVDADKDFKVAPEYYFDSTNFSEMTSAILLKPEKIINKRKFIFSYPVQSSKVNLVHLVYNDDVIMQYKLKIKEPPSYIKEENSR